MPSFVDLTGQRFGRLAIIERAPTRFLAGKQRTFWRAQCDCGNTTEVMADSLRSGNSRSCGCLSSDTTRRLATTHGLSKSKTYSAWSAAKARCSNPKHPMWRYYGSRGIRMSEEWATSFETFLRDMGEAPPKMELERVDNDGPYAAWNCKWATRSEQLRNRRPRSVFKHAD